MHYGSLAMAPRPEDAPDGVDDDVSEGTPEPPLVSAKPKKKKARKKARKKLEAGLAAPKRAPLTPEGVERPRFLLDFPDDPRLEELIAHFEAGDYAAVRRLAPELEKSASTPVALAAAELLWRTRPDPLAKYLLLASAVLLVFLVLHSYLGHG